MPEPAAAERLEAEGFLDVFRLPLEARAVYIHLLWRPPDLRARILYVDRDTLGRSMSYCVPLTALRLVRRESCLRLVRLNQDRGRLELWANLRFSLFERMVIFYGAFVAMKRQDQMESPLELDDWFDSGEKEEIRGEIEDGHRGFVHEFRVLKDPDSRCVRLEARVIRGRFKGVPVWTAFVTRHIGSRSWMRRLGRVVEITDLQPYVFCDNYTLPRGSTGTYRLHFASQRGKYRHATWIQLMLIVIADAESLMYDFHRISFR